MSDLTYTDFDFELDRIGDMAKQQAHSLDAQLKVQFYKHAELNSFASRPVEEGGQGRKIFVEKVYVRILMPANRLNIVEREATAIDRQRFARQFHQFLAGEEQLSSGTPLSELPTISASQVLELKALKVDTVEQLANMPDNVIQLLGVGGAELKRRASTYLARAASNETLVAESASLKATNVALQAQIDELRAMVEKATKSVADEVKVTVKTQELAKA